MEQPAGLAEWGPSRQSWKGDGAGGGAAAAEAAPGGSFPMSEGVRGALEALTAEGAGMAGWLGSPQSRELACHALEQYTSRPWRKASTQALPSHHDSQGLSDRSLAFQWFSRRC